MHANRVPIRVSRAIGFAIALGLSVAPEATAQPLAAMSAFRWAPDRGELVFSIDFTADVRPRVHDELAEKGYFYIDFYGVDGPATPADWRFDYPGLKLVRRHYYPEAKVLRFVFYTREGSSAWFDLKGGGRKFSVATRWFEGSPKPLRAAPVGAANGANGGAGSSRKLVVIDPGHGGESAGARTSVKIGGSHHLEKDLVLSIARRMVPFFEQSPNLSVILTRWDDRDVSLDDRIRIAEQADADLFVSIHLNAQSSAKKTARGFEVYYLDDGARATNRHLESIENDRGVGAATRVASGGGLMAILNDLAGEKVAAFRAESRELGETIDQVFSRSGPFRSRTRGVKAANFRVLMNSEMPAVLAECGFIDHPEDAAMLVGPNGQDRVAALLFNSINHYFARVDPAFQAYLAPVD